MESLIELFQAKTTIKEYKTSKFTFKLRTLTADELIDVLRRSDIIATSEATKVYIAKKVTLAYSLESVNGVEILAIPEISRKRLEEKDVVTSKVDSVLQVLGAFDADVIDDLYTCYNALVTENAKSRESLKKDLVDR